MAELSETVEQFARDLVANNVAGLMPAFTANGISQAMALQAQPASAQGSREYEIADQGNNLYHITFRGDDGEGTIFTQWVDDELGWKVDQIGRVEAE